MKLISLLVNILVIFQIVIVIKGINNNWKESKWLLYKEDLYYVINTPNYFSYHEAQMFCLDNGMINFIQPMEYVGLGILLTEQFGKKYPLWLLDEKFVYGSTSMNPIFENCTALDKNESTKMNCTTKLGLICKATIFGGIIQYRNGTHLEMNIDEVNRFCNPTSNEYDKLIEFCLLMFNQPMLYV
ncbi:uncharacterized protein LOC124419735 [Lucilia cuprina]|uniref:uncharacterized protein LOC124419735 n=1 Tax=Lucilia cuprina TaxID=7375 RepID=UPI001F0598C8|nr:uncharacterized protein LOC124419735 [Lucilia cuprina]